MIGDQLRYVEWTGKDVVDDTLNSSAINGCFS